MYTSSDFVSVTDVRKDISHVIDSLKKDKQKIIFKNNKPTAVLVDFDFYERLSAQRSIEIAPLDGSEVFAGTPLHKNMLELMRSA